MISAMTAGFEFASTPTNSSGIENVVRSPARSVTAIWNMKLRVVRRASARSTRGSGRRAVDRCRPDRLQQRAGASGRLQARRDARENLDLAEREVVPAGTRVPRRRSTDRLAHDDEEPLAQHARRVLSSVAVQRLELALGHLDERRGIARMADRNRGTRRARSDRGQGGEVPPLLEADAGGELHPVALGIEQCAERRERQPPRRATRAG